MNTDASPVPVKAGQTWTPSPGNRSEARFVFWTGTDPCWGKNAVRWHHPGSATLRTMQFKAFVAWVRKTGATCAEKLNP